MRAHILAIGAVLWMATGVVIAHALFGDPQNAWDVIFWSRSIAWPITTLVYVEGARIVTLVLGIIMVAVFLLSPTRQ